MNLRQYTGIFVMAFAVTLGFPSLKIEEILNPTGEIFISPGAGVSAWPGFIPIDAYLLVKDIERQGQSVSFKLAMDNELYLVSADCGSTTSIKSTQFKGPDTTRVLYAADWVCKNNAS